MTTQCKGTTALGTPGREDEELPSNLTAAQVRAVFTENWKQNFRDI